ncbi:DUF7511 domain-containing protein [Salinigranum halophilum]|uniref:DUF7511 domain-containing protein n=1 Tax=Salinigranum halophilum TaxID=2565931 RepID=UPI00115C97B8|nr:hypothetical protein [Salinigranum halophilum]
MSELPLRRDADESPTDVSTPAEHAPRGASLFDDGTEYAAIVVPAEDRPDECTIFPVDVGEAELVTTWASAAEGSFVALDEMR